MLKEWKEIVWKVNLELPKYELVIFTWGANPMEAVRNAVVLEEIANMA